MWFLFSIFETSFGGGFCIGVVFGFVCVVLLIWFVAGFDVCS